VSSQWLGQCSQCGLLKSSGVMGTVLPQCMCDWKMRPPPTKREWVNLTDEEIEQAYETTGHYQKLRPQDKFAVYALAKAIAAKLKEKNT